MRFVDHERAVRPQLRIALRLGKQNAVGHQLDRGAHADLVVEAHLVADQLSQLGFEFLGDARRYRARSDAARLRVADQARRAAAHLEQDFRNLGGFAGAGLAADDDDRVLLDRTPDLLAPGADRQRRVVGNARQHEADFALNIAGYLSGDDP